MATIDPKPLAGCYVISLRPVGAHAPMRRAAAAQGARLIALSGLRIVMRGDDPTCARLQASLGMPRVLVTSPNAVRAALALQPGLRRRPGQQWFAVGAGTAAALRRAGIDQIHAPQRMDSEGLLALPGLQGIAGTDLGMLTAPGGRGLLQPALEGRGARVLRVDLYRREPTRPSPRALQALCNSRPAPLWLALSSGEALDAVLAALPAAATARVHEARVACASERLQDHARARGFAHSVLAAGPRPRQLLAAMAASATGH